MMRPVVNVDVDGVLADLLTPCLRVLSNMRLEVIDQADVLQWELDPLIPEGRVDEFWKSVARIYRASDLEPLPGAIEGMRRLGEVATVYVVSSHLPQSSTWAHDRDAWLLKHFGIKLDRIIHTHAKSRVAGAMLIDDRPKNAQEWHSTWSRSGGIGVLWAQPYNATADFGGGVVRTDSWDNVMSLVDAQHARLLSHDQRTFR